MAGFPSGVVIVTATGERQQLWGMTCSSLCSVTVEPPTLAVGMRGTSPTLRAALYSGAFAVNVLHAGGRSAAELFASGAPDRFDQVFWELPEGAAGPQLTRVTRAVADCRISQTVRVGSQCMVFGEVYAIRDLADEAPLLYGLRRYGFWPSAPEPDPLDEQNPLKTHDQINR
jgi:flavin reductase (DIM6/NTAB) family NADH-FMN oxidoreductase RutF